MADMGSAPPDAKNLARLHLDEIGQKIDKLIGQKDTKIDDTSLAHLKEIRHPDRHGLEGKPERQRAVIADVPSDRRARFLASRWSRLARSSIMDMALLERPFAGAHGDGHALNPIALKPSCHRADRLRGQGSPSPSLPEHWTAADSPDLTATARLRMACGRASIRLGSIPA